MAQPTSSVGYAERGGLSTGNRPGVARIGPPWEECNFFLDNAGGGSYHSPLLLLFERVITLVSANVEAWLVRLFGEDGLGPSRRKPLPRFRFKAIGRVIGRKNKGFTVRWHWDSSGVAVEALHAPEDPVWFAMAFRRAVYGRVRPRNDSIRLERLGARGRGRLGQWSGVSIPKTGQTVWDAVARSLRPQDDSYFLIVPGGRYEQTPAFPAVVALMALPRPPSSFTGQLRQASELIWAEAVVDTSFVLPACALSDLCVEIGLGAGEDIVKHRLNAFGSDLTDLTTQRYQPVVAIDKSGSSISVEYWESLIRHKAGDGEFEYAFWAVEAARLWGAQFSTAFDGHVVSNVVAMLNRKRDVKISANVHWSSVGDEDFVKPLNAQLDGGTLGHLVLELSETEAYEQPDKALHPNLTVDLALDDYPKGELTEILVLRSTRVKYLKVDGCLFEPDFNETRDYLFSRVSDLVELRASPTTVIVEHVSDVSRLATVLEHGKGKWLVQFKDFHKEEAECDVPNHELPRKIARALKTAAQEIAGSKVKGGA